MSFRTVVIKNRCKLDLKLNYMVCRSEDEQRIFIPEISFLILESTAISITSALLSELIKNNVKIIFCDEKHNPESELCPYYGNFNVSKRIVQQVGWTDEIKNAVWVKIVGDKIRKQADMLKECGLDKESALLNQYIGEIQEMDASNREGFAAKVYFNALFGEEFSRRVDNDLNAALNYGYSILLSCFNREIVKYGYLTQIGIFHKNEFNFYNLASDLMEPFRIVVDRLVYNMKGNFENFKDKILNIFNVELKIDNKKQMLENAISIYCGGVLDALTEKDLSLMKFYDM